MSHANTMTTAEITARLDEIKAVLLRRDCRDVTAEDVAIVREWSELLEELQGRLWPAKEQR